MKPVLVSQRVDVHQERRERRDALDQRLMSFLAAGGYLGVPVPNIASLVGQLWNSLRPHGVVLSGGNDLVALGGNAPERDATEHALLRLAERDGVPVFAICRGLQLLLADGGVHLDRVEGHTGTRHVLQVDGAHHHQVNSFHDWGATDLPPGFTAIAVAADGVIEAARHESRKMTGVMWHPERESPFSGTDLGLLTETLG